MDLLNLKSLFGHYQWRQEEIWMRSFNVNRIKLNSISSQKIYYSFFFYFRGVQTLRCWQRRFHHADWNVQHRRRHLPDGGKVSLSFVFVFIQEKQNFKSLLVLAENREQRDCTAQHRLLLLLSSAWRWKTISKLFFFLIVFFVQIWVKDQRGGDFYVKLIELDVVQCRRSVYKWVKGIHVVVDLFICCVAESFGTAWWYVVHTYVILWGLIIVLWHL